MKKTYKLVGCLLVIVAFLGACSDQEKSQAQDTEEKARDTDVDMEQAIVTGMSLRVDSQPIPVFAYSQEYQTLLDLLSFRATGTHGTAYRRTDATGELVEWCPTQGAPIPSSYQATPSQHYVDIKGDDTRAKVPVDLPEPTGVITGDSQATWILCIDDDGNTFPWYMEPGTSFVGATINFPPDKRLTVNEATYRFATTEEEAVENYDAMCADGVIVECD